MAFEFMKEDPDRKALIEARKKALSQRRGLPKSPTELGQAVREGAKSTFGESLVVPGAAVGTLGAASTALGDVATGLFQPPTRLTEPTRRGDTAPVLPAAPTVPNLQSTNVLPDVAAPPIATPGRPTSFTQADAGRYEIPAGSFAGSAGKGSLTTIPEFDPALLDQQTRIAMMKKQQGFAPGERGPAIGSEEEARRAGPGFTTIGQSGGQGLLGNEATAARNKEQSINNQYDLAISRAKNSLTGRAKGAAIAKLEGERSRQLGIAQELPSEERIARMAADARGGVNPLDVARLEQREREFEQGPARELQSALLQNQLGINRDRARIQTEQEGRQGAKAAEALRSREDTIFNIAADPAMARSVYSDLAGRPGIPQEIALSLVDGVLRENPGLTGAELQNAVNQSVSNYLAAKGAI